MNNQMNAAAVVIRQRLLKTEAATNAAAAEQAGLLELLLRKRGELECAISLGDAEVHHAHQAIGRTLASMRSLAVTHKGLHVIADEGDGDGGWDYGTSSTVHHLSEPHIRAA